MSDEEGYYDDEGYGDDYYDEEEYNHDEMDEQSDIHLKMTKKKSSKKYKSGEEGYEGALTKGLSAKWESKRFKNAEGQIFILQSEIFDQMMIKIKQEVVELVCMDIDDCILIFHEFGWSMQKLQNKYFPDQEKVFKNLGFDREEKYYEDCKKKGEIKEIFRNGSDELCNLCFCESEMVGSCKQGHTFCTDCWKGYIEQKLREKNPFFRCMMEGCNSCVRHSFIIQVLSQGQENSKLKENYKKFLGMSYVEENKNIQYCPGNNCEYAAEKLDGVSVNQVKCLCGTSFCFKCQQSNHYPCTCKQHRDFNEMLGRDDANLLWIIQNAKLCPFCNRAVERSMGCNYIRCSAPCNKSFCYVCEQPWQDDADGTHHKSAHMNCNNYTVSQSTDKQKLTDKEKQQKMLEKCSFYVGKFKDCLRSIEVIKKKKDELVKPTRETLCEQLKISLHDSQFLEDGFNILLDSRQTLQWSYAFAYFFTPEQVKSKALFEDLQMLFAGFCESLAILLSNDFIDYTKEIQKTDFSSTFPPQILTKYQEFKNRISKLSNAIKNNQNSLLESVANGSVYID
ncbi:hypothetical protein ABPG74_012597 [Tetrahymena malaccensis]